MSLAPDFLSSPHLISASPHPPFLASHPGLFAKLMSPHPDVPNDIPPSLGQLPTSPDSSYSFHYSPCPYLLLSSPRELHSSHPSCCPGLTAAGEYGGQRPNARSFASRPPWHGAVGSRLHKESPVPQLGGRLGCSARSLCTSCWL